jgi:hypothetical protein
LNSKSKSIPTAIESSPSIGHTSPDTETLPLLIGQPFNPLTCSVGDSPVSQSVYADNDVHRMTTDGFGQSFYGAFAYFDHDTSLLKMCQVSLLLDSRTFLEDWPTVGMMRNGVLYQHVHSVPHTHGNECSSWPTPLAQSHRADCPGERLRYSPHIETELKMRLGIPVTNKQRLHPHFLEYLMGYPIGFTDLKG